MITVGFGLPPQTGHDKLSPGQKVIPLQVAVLPEAVYLCAEVSRAALKFKMFSDQKDAQPIMFVVGFSHKLEPPRISSDLKTVGEVTFVF